MNRLRTYLSCLFLGLAYHVYSQQLSLFTQYRENQTLLNPAAVGSQFLVSSQNLGFGASYRAQWQGFENAPVTATLRGEYLWLNGGTVSLLTGGYLINDQTGPTGFTGLYGRIGGVLSDDPEYGGVSAGLSFGAVQYRVNSSEIRLRQPNDVLADENQNQVFPDVGIGVFAYRRLDDGPFDGDVVYGGISMPQALGLDLNYKSDNGDFYLRRVRHFYGMLGFYKFLADDGFLEPSVWVKYASNAPVNVDVNLRYQMAQNFWVGIGGASAKTMHLEAGFVLGENIGFENTLQVGYGFDYSFSSFGPYTGGTHEINVSYFLDK